jgi:cob(I)alamin adenosyltransferase
MKVYTKKGDRGETGLLGNVRVSKDHLRVVAYGDTDELVSWLGLLRDELQDEELHALLGSIQLELFLLNSELATPAGGRTFGELLEEEAVEALEQWIDAWDTELPPLKSFILPGGNRVASSLHVARTVCRRAERSVVSLAKLEDVRPVVLRYLNRLSDMLFSMARLVAFRANTPEVKISDLRRVRLGKSAE